MRAKRLPYLIVITAIACAEPPPLTRTTDPAQSFEDWKSSLPRLDTGAWLVEGDIPVYEEAGLFEYYEVASGLTVLNTGDREIWPLHKKYNLTYCISNSFGVLAKSTVIAALGDAAAAWETVAEVNFYYDSSQDSSCNNSNTNVLFNVRAGTCDQDCLAASFFPSAPRSQRELIIANILPSGNTTLTGVLKHELGHVLGFRHEHIWDDCTGEPTDNAEQLTTKDTNSVMYYRWCSGLDADQTISTRDRIAAACMYNRTMPESACSPDATGTERLWRGTATRTFITANASLPAADHYLTGDFDGDGATDLFQYGRGGRGDLIGWSNGDNTFTNESVTVDGLYDPFTGDFDGDGRDDIFWYAPTSRADRIWWGNANRSFTSSGQSLGNAYIPLPGDFNCDGRTDIIWYSPTSNDSVWYAGSNRTFGNQPLSIGDGFRPFTGDFDGDDCDDVFWYAPGTQSDKIWWGTEDEEFEETTSVRSNQYTPVVGNFDGQEGDDIIWYRPGDPNDPIYWSNGDRTFEVETRTIGGHFVPLTGDFNSSGIDDILWYSPL